RSRSTGAATMRSASRSTSFFPRSTTTRLRPCWASTSWSARRPGPTRKRGPCCGRSISPSGGERRPALRRGKWSLDMAKKSAIENNLRKQRLAKKYAARRKRLLDVANDEKRPMEERFEARIRLAALPRNGAIIRVRNRCEVTGRPRGYYRKMKMSRIALRELGNQG